VLADGQSIKAVDLKMVKGAVVTGTVYDDTGQPAVGSRVQVLQSRPDFRTGLRSLVAMGSGSGQMGAPPFTDNRGVYRIYGLPPGTYVVMAEVSPLMTMALRQNHIGEWSWLEATAAASGPATPPAASRPRVYAPIFFPGTLSAVNAAPIRLTSGEERSGLDIRLSMVPTSNLEGIIQLPSEVASNDVQIALLRNSDESSRLMAQRTPDASFRFAIPNLAPGTYTAVARALPRSSSDVNAVTEFTITSADQNITLQAQPGPKVSGRVSLQPSATQVPTSLAGIQIALSPVTTTPLAALGTPTATTNASGTFAFRAVLPGQYRVRITANGANLGAGWILRSATVKNQDVLDTPITIGSGEQIDAALTFTERLSELSGSLVDASGRPAPDYVVVVFSSESGTWFPASRRIAAMRPGLDGRYRFTNLPAGQYLLGAVTDVEQFQWFDPEFLAQLKPASIAITLSETAPTVQNLRIGTK
jgi:hypothetical protein